MKKLIIFISCILIIVSLYAFDAINAKSYNFKIVSSSVKEIVADGYSPAKITVKLTKNGKAVKDHTINIVASNGTLKASRLVTNSNGEITFVYYSYLYLEKLSPLTDVTFYLSDESNSTFFMVEAKFDFTIKAVQPVDDSIQEDWQSLIIEE